MKLTFFELKKYFNIQIICLFFLVVMTFFLVLFANLNFVFANDNNLSTFQIEPDDEYKPDGYYEPYDFSFIKPKSISEIPEPTQYPLPNEFSNYENKEPIVSSPNIIDQSSNNNNIDYTFMQTSISTEVNDNISILPQSDLKQLPTLNFESEQLNFNNDTSNTTNNNNIPNSTLNMNTLKNNTNNDTLSSSNILLSNVNLESYIKIFTFYNKKQVRYKIIDKKLEELIDKAILCNLNEKDWNEFYKKICTIYLNIINNNLSLLIPLDEEFEKINSVLIKYIQTYNKPEFENMIILKYKTNFLAFLGIFSNLNSLELTPTLVENETKYKILRLAGGDILKVYDKLIVFTLKPLLVCINEILNEVANGEFYKVEVLFRIMSSDDKVTYNLLKPYFQLIKLKFLEVKEKEKINSIKINYSKAYELLNKIK